jgi:hypothetical protein
MRETLPPTRPFVVPRGSGPRLPQSAAASVDRDPLVEEFDAKAVRHPPALRGPLAKKSSQCRVGPARTEVQQLRRLEVQRHAAHLLEEVTPDAALLLRSHPPRAASPGSGSEQAAGLGGGRRHRADRPAMARPSVPGSAVSTP